MGTYARDTKVPAERSRGEIEKILARYGADQFGYGIRSAEAMIGFRLHDRQVQFHLPLPTPNDEEFQLDHRKNERSEGQRIRLCEQSTRQRWRALALAIKAKLEEVESGISSFETVFLSYLVVPGSGGKTVAQTVLPELEQALKSGNPANLSLGWEKNR